MAKKDLSKGKPQGIPGLANHSDAYKPKKIGPIIKHQMEQKRITKETVARFMNVTVRAVERWFDRATLSVNQMMKLSELLEYDLFLLYHPNVKPLPHPLEAEVARLKEEIETLRGVKYENGELTKENLKLQGKVEQLELIVDSWKRRGI